MSRFRPYLPVLLIFALFRIVTAAATYSPAHEHRDTIAGSWVRSDAVHYLTIAQNGYIDPTASPADRNFRSRFPPFYPFLISLGSKMSGLSLFASAVLLSNLLLLAASCIFFRLALEETKNRSTALWSVAFLNAFPTSYFGSAPYAESLGLFFIMLVFYELRAKRSPLLASVCVAGAILTRTQSILLLAPLCFWLAQNRRITSSREIFCAAVLPLLVFAIQQDVVVSYLHLPGYFLSADYSTPRIGKEFPFAETYHSLLDMMEKPRLLTDESFMFTVGWSAFFMLAILAVGLAAKFRLAAIYSVYSFATAVFFGSLFWVISLPRFAWCTAPALLAVAMSRSNAVKSALLLLSTALLYYFTRRYVSGWWAF